MTTGGLYLHERLTQMLPQVLERRYRELPYENGMAIPTVADLDPGVREVSADIITDVGNAEILADGAWDIPLVEISANEDRYKVLMIASAMSWTWQEERAAQLANFPLGERKLKAARRSIAEKSNKFAAFGNQASGFTGFFNNPLVSVTNSSFNPWTATASDLVDFFLDLVQRIVTSSNNIERPTDIHISSELDFRLMSATMPNSSMSAKQSILGRFADDGQQQITIMSSQECRSVNLEFNGVQAQGTNKDRIVVYCKDPDVVSRHIEASIAQLFPPEYQEVRSGRKVIPLFSCTTPTMINYPGAFSYVDIAKKP